MPFSDIFGNFGGGCNVVTAPVEYQIDREFIAMAIELIDDIVPTSNAVWISVPNDFVADPSEPWNVEPEIDTEHAVRIVFYPPNLQTKKFLQYRIKTEITEGSIMGIFYKTHFVPKLKDLLRWNGRELKPCYIDEITVVKDTIVYIAQFDL